MDVTLRPTVHIYRWADITAIDTQALPVNGAAISFTNPAPAYYVSGQVQEVPPADVLRYLGFPVGISAADFFKTNASGKAAVPLLADTIYQTSTNPNSRPTSTYNVELSYVKGEVTYYGQGNTSFMNPYPNLDPAHMRSAATILLNGLVLDLPDLYIGPITVTPTPIYAGMDLNIQVEIGNRGETAVSNLEVIITGLLNQTEQNFNYTTHISAVLSGGTAIAQTTWLNMPEGVHNVAVVIDPNNTIPEIVGGKDNNKKSQLVTVLPNLPDLSITSSDIVFVGPSPSTSAPVTAIITVHNDGRAAANNVLVQVYVAGDRFSGQLVNTTTVTVGQGAAADAIVVWKPNIVGTYPVYVYLNADGKVTEYSNVNNIASTSITVTLIPDSSDWLFDGTPAHANRTLPTTTLPFEVWTNLTIENYGNLTLDGTKMTISQSSNPYFLQVTVRDNGVLILKNGAQLNSNYEMRLYLLGNSKLIVDSSSILSNVKIQADDHSVIEIESSTIVAEIVTPDTSHAIIDAANTTFVRSWSLGGYTEADMTNVTMPSMRAYGHAVINHYRWIVANILDGNNRSLQNAYVEVNHITEAISYHGYTDATGKVMLRAICDIYTGEDQTIKSLGSYELRTTFTYNGTAYEGTEPWPLVSLRNFTSAPYAMVSEIYTQVPGARPDLDPPLTVSDDNPARDQIVVVSTQVTNIGVVPAYDVLVMFNDTGLDWSPGVRSYLYIIPVIQPQETVYLNVNWTASYPLAVHNLTVAIDPYGRINELNNSNNGNYVLVDVRGIADLSVQRSDITLSPTSPVRGQTTTITAVVHNSGDIAANNVLVSFYATAPGGSPILLDINQTIGRIDPNGSGEAHIAWSPSVAGTYTISILVDGLNAISEITETNNNLSFEQKVLNFADLTPEQIIFNPASPVSVNTNESIEATIKNIGEVGSSNVIVRFYVGDTVTGTLIDEQTISSIGAGQSKMIKGSWNANITQGLKTQPVMITVWVNPQSLIPEVNYDNNILAQSITVNELRPDVFFPEGINMTNAGSAVNHSGQGETVIISTIAGNSGNSPAMATEFVFYAKGEDDHQVILGSIKKDVGIGQSVVVNMTWLINVTMGNYTIVINANPDHLIDESNITNDQVSVAFIIDAPNAKVIIDQLDTRTYDPGTNIFVTGRVANQNTSDPIAGAKITIYLAQGGVQKGVAFPGVTDANGNFAVSLYIPEGLDGDYQVHASVTIGDKTTSGMKNVTVKAVAEGGVPWYLYLIILAGIAAAIIFFSAWLYKYGLGKMVECGECGSLIPDSSKRCPKCGVEFEVGTAKCSECGAWIPSNSTSCPECNAKFITDAIEEEEDAYLKKMREQYDAYVDTFREEARKVLGKKYSDGKFPDWWKKQSSYVSFENWLSQEEEKRKVGGMPCSSCGTLNPRGSTICHKCGSTMELPKADPALAEEQKTDAQQPKPLRRIVRRPVEKKQVPKPEDGPTEESKPEDNNP